MPLRPPYRPAGDRVYQAIKARLIAYEFPQGRRIYLEPIAESLGVSTTPVREALNRLAERDLVIKARNKGFYAMTLTETRIKGYFEVTRNLLGLGIDNLPPYAKHEMRKSAPVAELVNRLNRRDVTDAHVLARYTAEVLNTIATITENDATQHAVDMANDHLFLIRTVEYRYVPDTQTELKRLCELILSGRTDQLKAAINDYVERRLALLPDLVKEARSTKE